MNLSFALDAGVNENDLAGSVAYFLKHIPTLPDPGQGETLERWRMLAALSARDLCIAKTLEAHYDAQAILAELAPSFSHRDLQLMAVWAAEAPDAIVHYFPENTRNGYVTGEKAWCSGAEIAQTALVTAHRGDDRYLVMIDMHAPGIRYSNEVWEAVGMARLKTSRVMFDHVPAVRVGEAGSYLSRPGFWHGGAGVAACWYGAAVAIAETLRTHPRIANDAFAAAHLGYIDMYLQAAGALLRQLADRIDAEPQDAHFEDTIRARSFVERTCAIVLDRVGRALGAAPLCHNRQHALLSADLTTFIRQSHAEHDWAALGRATTQRDSSWML